MKFAFVLLVRLDPDDKIDPYVAASGDAIIDTAGKLSLNWDAIDRIKAAIRQWTDESNNLGIGAIGWTAQINSHVTFHITELRDR